MSDSLLDSYPVAIVAGPNDPWVRLLKAQAPASVKIYADPAQLRRDLAALPLGSCRVIVGMTPVMDPVNVAAALAHDGFARSVTLVVPNPSGSLRSRAAQAHISSVIDQAKVLEAAAVAPKASPAPVPPNAQKTTACGEASASFLPYHDPSQEPSMSRSRDAQAQVRRRSPFSQERQGQKLNDVLWSGDGLDEPELGGSEASLTLVPPILPKDPPRGDGEPSLSAANPYRSSGVFEPGASHSGKAGPKLVLVSGRGGVGKSAIAALMALTAASWGIDVALVDLDLCFGNLFGYFGLQGPCDLTPLGKAPGMRELTRCGRPAAESVTLFGPCAKPEYAETVVPKISAMLAALSQRFRLVIVDGGTSWGDGVAQAVQAADRLIVCADERAGAIGTMARVGSLAVRLGVARTRVCRLVNRCDPRHRDEGFLARADEGFETARSLRIYEGGVEVPELMSSGHAADLVGMDNPFVTSVTNGLAAILSELGLLPEQERSRRLAAPSRWRKGGEGRAKRRAS